MSSFENDSKCSMTYKVLGIILVIPYWLRHFDLIFNDSFEVDIEKNVLMTTVKFLLHQKQNTHMTEETELNKLNNWSKIQRLDCLRQFFSKISHFTNWTLVFFCIFFITVLSLNGNEWNFEILICFVYHKLSTAEEEL